MRKYVYITADSLDQLVNIPIQNRMVGTYKYLLIMCNKFGNKDWEIGVTTSTFTPDQNDRVITFDQLLYILELRDSIGTNAAMDVVESLGIPYNQIDPLVQVMKDFQDETCFRLY